MLKTEKYEEVVNKVHNDQMAEFHNMVEKQVDDGMDYLEAVVAVCEEYGIEVEECIPFLSNKLLSNIQRACHNKNLVKDSKNPSAEITELFNQQ